MCVRVYVYDVCVCVTERENITRAHDQPLEHLCSGLT
jgi:hypothetical protein